MARAAGRIAVLPHRVLAYRGGDGFPLSFPHSLAGTPQDCGWSLRQGPCRPAGVGPACSRMTTGRHLASYDPSSYGMVWTA